MTIKVGDLVHGFGYAGAYENVWGRVVEITGLAYFTKEYKLEKYKTRKIKSVLHTQKLCKHCGYVEEKRNLIYNSTNTNYIYTKEKEKERIRCTCCGVINKQEYVITERVT